MVADSGDSSSSSPSAESSFRLIDDVFLQTRTRVWLGEVLQIRLNEQISIADSLADGELLFEVSKELWKMMLGKRKALLKEYEFEPFSSRNSRGYMPYSNVDSFLKICKILGLAGIDLFSPSDVVEKRNTRKVCMCIRAVSKKARSMHLNVPDFDKVTHTVAMPTDMVEYIRKSWELSHHGNFCSSNLNGNYGSGERLRQKHLNAIAGRSCNLYCQEAEDAKRNFSQQLDGSAVICSQSSMSQISSESTNSPEVFSVDKSYAFDLCAGRLDFQNQMLDDCDRDNMLSPSSSDSSLDFSAESGARNGQKSDIVDQIYVDPNLEDGASVVSGSEECSTPQSNITDDCPEILDISRHGFSIENTVLLDGACACTYSSCSKETRTPESKLRDQNSDDENVEVSSIASVNSLSSAVQSFDFLGTENAFETVLFPDSAASEDECVDRSKSPGNVKYDTKKSLTMKKEEYLDMKGMEIVFFSPLYIDDDAVGYLDNVISYDNGFCTQLNTNLVHEGRDFLRGQSCLAVGFSQWDQKGKCQTALVPNRNDGCFASSVTISPAVSNEDKIQLFETVTRGAFQLKNMERIASDNMKVCSTTTVRVDSGKQRNQCLLPPCNDDINQRHDESDAASNCIVVGQNANENKEESENKNGIDNPMVEGEADHKKRPFLKAIVKGTAAVGAMFLLFQFRKHYREKSSDSSKKYNQKQVVNGRDLLEKGKRSHKANGIYPTEKLRLGH